MYSRFTERARNVMQSADQEAQRLNHDAIGPVHILLGLTKENRGAAAAVLQGLGIELWKVRLEVEKLVQAEPDKVVGEGLPLSPRAKNAIEFACEEVRNLKHDRVGTEHLLLGLLCVRQGLAAQALRGLDLKLADVRKEVVKVHSRGVNDSESAGAWTRGAARTPGSSEPGGTRRGFFAAAAAVAFGSLALLVPAIAGVISFLNPLRQKGQGGGFVHLASLASLPQDGTPQRFTVIAERADAWNRFPNEAIGAVFLRRVSTTVQALQVICPHAGCSISYESTPTGGRFLCPCHAAAFGLDGKRLDETSMSPRDMDTLAVEIRSNAEVWVKFENFRTGTGQKVAQA